MEGNADTISQVGRPVKSIGDPASSHNQEAEGAQLKEAILLPCHQGSLGIIDGAEADTTFKQKKQKRQHVGRLIASDAEIMAARADRMRRLFERVKIAREMARAHA